MGKGWCDVDRNKLVFIYEGSYIPANLGEKSIKKWTVMNSQGLFQVQDQQRVPNSKR